MKYRFEKRALACLEVEKELGLARGGIREVKVYPDGTVDIDVEGGLEPAQKIVLETRLGLRNTEEDTTLSSKEV